MDFNNNVALIAPSISTNETLKAVEQRYKPTPEILAMMDSFRHVTNNCIRIGIEQNKTSLKSLSLAAYQSTKLIDLLSLYRLCAISRAAGILSNYRRLLKKGRKVQRPYCSKPVLVTCYRISMKNGVLHLPGKIRILLNRHTIEILSEPGIVIHSATLTPDHLSLSFSKKIERIESNGVIGIDRNLDNVTVAGSEENVIAFDLSRANWVKQRCRRTRSHFRRNDVRVGKTVHGKYGRIQKDRVNSLLHNVSRSIVAHAKANRLAIVMENIKGIRRLYRAGNGQGKEYRSRMNSWSYYELQRQIQYKAEWEGLEVIYVNARGTSAKCAMCGGRMVSAEEHRQQRCLSCGLCIDRDVNAARNIRDAGLRLSPKGRTGEAMVQERQTGPTPDSRCAPVQLSSLANS